MQSRSATFLLLLGLSLPFLGKPVHIDDTNFLRLAEGAVADPWRPHEIAINWQGSTERAFDVLSNPPGIAWWLSPFVDAAIWIQHLWMMPWLLLAAWGAWRLGERFTSNPAATCMLTCAAPIGLLATQSFTPDLPLLACTLAGFAGLTGNQETKLEHRWTWALLLGCASLFRYSGIALLPLVTAWALLQRNPRAAWTLSIAAAAPILTLAAHDLMAYGQVHVTAMMGFQGTSGSGRDTARKLIASVTMLGGAAVLPILCWARLRSAVTGLAIGLGLGFAGAETSQLTGSAFWATLIFGAAGGASLGGALLVRWKDTETRWLASWTLLGLAFLLSLRFTASRYWIPFFPAIVLLGVRAAGPKLIRVASIGTVLVSIGLAVDDHDLALIQRDMAQRITEMEEPNGWIAGHWGWQYHLRNSGWQLLEEDSPIPEGHLLAVSSIGWPQAPADGCFRLVECILARPTPGLPRVLAPRDGANFHASLSAAFPSETGADCEVSHAWNLPPIESYAPWTFSDEPQEILTIWRSCEEDSPRIIGR